MLSLVPILLFEVILRLADYGYSYPLALPSSGGEQGRELMLNAEYAGRFYRHLQTVPELPAQRFRARKGKDTLRVVLAGSSLFYEGEADRLFTETLKEYLERALPGRTTELINVSLPLASSYITRLQTADIMRQDPDILLLSVGEAEFYGVLGSSSALSLTRSSFIKRLSLRLQDLRIYQLLQEQVLLRILPAGVPGSSLQELALDREIPLRSELYLRTRSDLVNNLLHISRICRQEGVELIFTEFPADLIGQMPRGAFLQDPGVEKSETVRAFRDAMQRRDSLHIERELESFRIWEKQSPFTSYLQGLAALETDPESAWIHLNAARDGDGFRSRSSRDMNDAMRKLAMEEGRPFAAIQRLLYAASPASFNVDGSLSAEGRRLMAERLAEVILTLISESAEGSGSDEPKMRVSGELK